MSPEQKRDTRSINQRSDIFSFGVLLYEMLTGRVPVGRFREPQELRDDTPPLLNQIVLHCLQEDQEDRYPSFTEVIADLNRLTQKGLVYREALARMTDSVSHIRQRAKTALSHRVKSAAWRKRLQLLGLLMVSAVVIIVLILYIPGLLRKNTAVTPRVRVAKKQPVSDSFGSAEDLLEENRYDEALTILREIRTTAGHADDTRRAAEAQWRIAKIHEQRGSYHYAGIAYGYFVDEFGKSREIVGEDREAEALFKAGKYKSQDKDYDKALNYLYRLRTLYPNYPDGEEAMLREVRILDENIKVKRSQRDSHRQKIAQTGRVFVDRFPESKAREEVYWRMVEAYRDMGDKSNYARAVSVLEEMGRAFPKSVYLPLYEAAEISRSKLKDKTRARRLYQAFLQAMPESDKAEKARSRLKKL